VLPALGITSATVATPTAERGSSVAGCTYEQKARVQIAPPLPMSAGQKPDRQGAVRLLDLLSAVRPQGSGLGDRQQSGWIDKHWPHGRQAAAVVKTRSATGCWSGNLVRSPGRALAATICRITSPVGQQPDRDAESGTAEWRMPSRLITAIARHARSQPATHAAHNRTDGYGHGSARRAG
jgi:hypothetical protein